jgi:peptide/nickel transport system permease protein
MAAILSLFNKKKNMISTAEGNQVEVASQWQLMWWKFRRHKIAMLGGIIVLLYYFVAAIANK